MSIQYINTGSSANAGNGDSLRSAFIKVNNNFAYLSTASFGGTGGNGYTGSTGTQGAVGYTGSAGSGIVNSGQARSLAYYATTGTTLSQRTDITYTPGVVGVSFPILQIGSAESSPSVLFQRNSYSANPTNGISFAQFHESADVNNFNFIRGRGTSDIPANIQNKDDIADILFVGISGGLPTVGVQISAIVDGTPVTGTLPTKLTFFNSQNSRTVEAAELSSSSTWKIDKLSHLSTTTSSIVVSTSLVPSQDLTYDLGSPTAKFRSLYVSSSTIYIGTSTISISQTGQMLVNGNDAVSKLEYFGGEGYGPRDAVAIAWNTSTFTFDTPGKELLTAIYDLKPGNKIRATGAPGFDQEFTIVGNTREYIRSGGYQMVGIDVAETTSTNRYAWSLYLPVKDKSATIANGTWTVSVSTTGTIVYPDGSVQTGASISIAALKTLVAASTDFADFKSRIAAL